MRVFISWSGEKSKQFALLLRKSLPDALQALDPFMSDEDISKGAQWPDELRKEFERVKFAIVCVASDNVKSPWLNFEAGATANAIGKPNVCPLLLDMSPPDLSGPLTMFQAATCSESDVHNLLRSMNQQSPSPITEERLQHSFGKWWPDFERELEKVRKISSGVAVAPRKTDDLVREMLVLVRDQNNAIAEILRRTWTINPAHVPGLGSGLSIGLPNPFNPYSVVAGSAIAAQAPNSVVGSGYVDALNEEVRKTQAGYLDVFKSVGGEGSLGQGATEIAPDAKPKS